MIESSCKGVTPAFVEVLINCYLVSEHDACLKFLRQSLLSTTVASWQLLMRMRVQIAIQMTLVVMTSLDTLQRIFPDGHI